MQSEQQISNGPDIYIDLQPGQFAMFGYGSLLLQSSMELTLGCPYTYECIPCALAGWRRTYDVIMPNRSFYEVTDEHEFTPQNIIYLNVRPSSQDVVNGLLYILEREQLAAFDQREWIYDRYLITPDLRGVVIQGGEAYVYAAKPEWLLKPGNTREWAALRTSYLKMVEDGLNELGAEFRIQYEKSTDPVPTHLMFADQRRLGKHFAQTGADVFDAHAASIKLHSNEQQ